MTEPQEFWCAIDIEKSRSELGRGIFAVGIVLAKSDGTIVDDVCFSNAVDVESDQFDDSTRGFWRQFPGALGRINANARHRPLVWSNVWQHLVLMNDAHGPFGRQHEAVRKFRWICDNPAYDIGQVNLMFYQTGRNYSLAEMFGDYVPTSDPTEQYETLLDAEKAWVDAQMRTEHSHFPVDDAQRDIEMMVAIREVLERRKQPQPAAVAENGSPNKRARET